MLHCVVSSNQSSWSDQLAWIEYAHNASTSAATGVSPFAASLGYQPPLLSVSEGELTVPSVQHHMQHCRQALRTTRTALLRPAEQNKRTPPRSGPRIPGRATGMAFCKTCSSRGRVKETSPALYRSLFHSSNIEPSDCPFSSSPFHENSRCLSCVPGEASPEQPFVKMCCAGLLKEAYFFHISITPKLTNFQ